VKKTTKTSCPPPFCDTMEVREGNPHRSFAVRAFLFPEKSDQVGKKMFNQRSVLTVKSLCLALLAGLILCGCKGPEPQDLPFETIIQGDGFYTGQGYGREEPNILVIAGPDEVDKPGLDVQFPSEVAHKLRQLDYSRSFVILVLQGRKPSSGYQVTIQQIAQHGDRVIVQAEFTEPQSKTFTRPAFTSPYHLVSVSRQGRWGQQIHFVVRTDDKEVAETFHRIP
jgi:hypothetical protein